MILEPGILLARIQSEWYRAVQRKRRILADEVIGRGVTHLDGGVAYRIKRLKGWNDLAAGKRLDLKFIVGGLRHVFRNRLGRTEWNVERFWPARGATPFQLGHGRREGWRREGSRSGQSGARRSQEFTTFHDVSPSAVNFCPRRSAR